MFNNNNNNFNHPAGNSNDNNRAQSYDKNFPKYNNSSKLPKQPDLSPPNTQQFQGNANFQNNQSVNKHQQTYQHPFFPQKFYQNNFQHSQQPRMWNKRPHSIEAQSLYSPEPKKQQDSDRLLNQQQRSNKPTQQRFYQATKKSPINKRNVQQSPQSPQSPQTSQNQQNPQNSPKPPKYSPAKIANDQKAMYWDTLFKSTLNKVANMPDNEVVNILRNNLQPTRASWSKIKDQITCDMMRMMAPLNVAKILVFGSTLTGLDFFGSDLDYYVELHQQPLENQLMALLQEISKLSKRNPAFRMIFRIDKARVPIVRLIHNATCTFCDVNVTSKFGYYNSYFIGHVLNYDPRIKELAIILKLWSKSYKIAKRSIMSNYCLVMIMIFFLQNTEFPMLLSIMENQSKICKMVLDTKSNWNFNFSDDINVSKNNTQTTRELLVDFFEFIIKINHENHVMSIYTGELILGTEFDTHKDLAEYRDIMKSQNIEPTDHCVADRFNIQDGFELNLNIGIKVTRHVEMFFDLIKSSYELCDQLKDKSFSEMLIQLFTNVKVPKRMSREDVKMALNRRFVLKIHSNAGELKMCQDILVILEKDNKDTIISLEACQLFYAEHVMESIKLFIEEIYCANVEEIESEMKENLKRVFKVTLFVDTVSRKKINCTNTETFANEKLLTKQKMLKKDPFALDVVMTLQTLDQGKTIEFEMMDNLNKKVTSLGIFGSFFAISVVASIKLYLKLKLGEVSLKNKI